MRHRMSSVLCSLLVTVLLSACSTASPPRTSENPTPAEATVQPSDAWADVRAALPADVPVYKPAFVPERFGAPQLLDVVATGTNAPAYTILYSAPNESLVFILNLGKGA